MKQTKNNRPFSKLLAAPALAALALIGLILLASPAQANNCAAVCDYTVSCFEMNAKAYLNANPNDADAEKKWKKFQRQQKKARKNCIKSCAKFEAAAVACYQKSGGAVTGPACVAATNCLRPYIK